MSEIHVSIPRDYVNPYAGFWRRTWAWLIDALVFMIPVMIILVLFDPEYVESQSLEGPGFLVSLLLALMSCFYFVAMESSAWQASLGKRALGIFVVDMAGQRMTWEFALVRAWPMYLPTLANGIYPLLGSVVGLAALVSCLAVAFTERKQGFHDKMAGCFVVRKGVQIGVK